MERSNRDRVDMEDVGSQSIALYPLGRAVLVRRLKVEPSPHLTYTR